MADWSVLRATRAASVRDDGLMAQRFDATALGVSPAEAASTKLQRRLLVAAMRVTAHRQHMGGINGGVVGLERPGWADAPPPSSSVDVVTGDGVSAAARRVSFVRTSSTLVNQRGAAHPSEKGALTFFRVWADVAAGGRVSTGCYSGTIAHAVLRHAIGDGVPSDLIAPLAYRRQAFLWCNTASSVGSR